MDDIAAKKLMAGILKRAYEDYTEAKSEDGYNFKDAKKFLHSAWCATLCEGVGIDYSKYILTSMENCKLSRNTFRYVEGELRDYQKSIKRLDKLKDEVINKAPKQEEIRGTDVGDPTEKKVESILKDKEIKRLQKIIDGIRKVYSTCDADKKVIIEESYWNNRYTDIGIAEKLCVSESTIRRYKKRIIYAMAVELNYL